MKQKSFLIFFALFFLLSARASADKFQSSFSNDYMTQSQQQDLKIPTVQAQKMPTTASTTIPAPAIQAPAIQAQAIQAPAIAPAMDIPASPDISMSVPSLKKTRITVPDFEERYKKLLAAKEEAKRKKKKSLIDSILDEIVHYGFLIVLVLVIFVVVYALRKDKETPGTGFQMPQHPEKQPGQQEPKKDIWQDEF